MGGAMPDLSFTLASFQRAFREGLIDPRPVASNSKFYLLADEAEGTPRLTYAFIERGEAIAIAVYFVAPPYKGNMCFQVGYAVDERHRNKGVATTLLETSVAELRRNFKQRTKLFYIEAVVEESNLASMTVAGRVLSSQPASAKDSNSGLPAFQYLRRVET